jgi:hypothetical protein
VEQVETHEERINAMDVKSLQQRLSSVEKRIRSLKSPHSRSDDIDSESTPSREPFCVDWETNMDNWWTHHPDWYVSKENNTHYCFSPMEDAEKAVAFRRIYDVQFGGACSNVTTK